MPIARHGNMPRNMADCLRISERLNSSVEEKIGALDSKSIERKFPKETVVRHVAGEKIHKDIFYNTVFAQRKLAYHLLQLQTVALNHDMHETAEKVGDMQDANERLYQHNAAMAVGLRPVIRMDEKGAKLGTQIAPAPDEETLKRQLCATHNFFSSVVQFLEENDELVRAHKNSSEKERRDVLPFYEKRKRK